MPNFSRNRAQIKPNRSFSLECGLSFLETHYFFFLFLNFGSFKTLIVGRMELLVSFLSFFP